MSDSPDANPPYIPRPDVGEIHAVPSEPRPVVDPLRPRFHVTAPKGWLNDPNGLFQRDGETHLFYQHNPHAAEWGPPSWAHVVSDDLVVWTRRPLALEPDAPPQDDGGCWSGCAVDDDGTPTLLYTGVKDGEQTTCLAFGDASLDRWTKHENNPVQRTPRDLGITQSSFRDPFVWRDGDGWLMVIGVSIDDRGEVLLYRSDDLRDWSFVSRLLAPEDRDRWPDDSHTWECPNLFPLGDRWVLIVSLATPAALAHPVAFVGDFDGERFVPERKQKLDAGYHGFYAPLTLLDDGGRRLIWGWLQEQRSREAQLAAGWSGAMSFPRLLELEDDRVTQRFVPELTALRGAAWPERDVEVDGVVELEGLRGPELELALTLERGSARRSGLRIHHGPGTTTGLAIDWDAAQLSCDTPGCSADGHVRWPGHAVELEPGADRAELHLFLDRSTLELVIDGRALSARAYPDALEPGRIELFSDGGAARATVAGWRLEAPASSSA